MFTLSTSEFFSLPPTDLHITALPRNLQGPKLCCKLPCTESSVSHYRPLPTSYFSLVFRLEVAKESINIDLIKESSSSVQVQFIRSLWAT